MQVVSIIAGHGTRDPHASSPSTSTATGDFSTYTLALVAGPTIDDPPDGLSTRSWPASAFSFKAGCPTPADCLPGHLLPAAAPSPQPDINYLAKDYDGFRR